MTVLIVLFAFLLLPIVFIAIFAAVAVVCYAWVFLFALCGFKWARDMMKKL